ncbi:hypothetical protein [Flavitalea sp.]|nr:hypothetical protein [Flavitalea sp.]
MQKILVYTIIVLVSLFTGCAGTTDQPLSSPQDAQVLLDALPDDAAIDSTAVLTSLGKKNLLRIKSNLKTLAATTSKQNKDSKSGLTLSKVQKEVIVFARDRHKDEWDQDIVVGGNESCSRSCLSSYNNGLNECNRLSGLSGATCSANNLTIYLLCLRNCSGTLPQ